MKISHKFIALLTVLVAVITVAFGFKAALVAAGTGGMPLVFGGLLQTDDVLRYLVAWGFLDAAGGYKLTIVAKTADYQILSPLLAAGDRSGTVFTNRGAVGAVIFTLPVINIGMKGVFYEFLGIADQNFTIASSPADTLLVVNDVAADSLAVATGGHKIGAHMRVVCDGVNWCAYGDSVGDTFGVTT